jgi:predicted dehydrogenase
MNLREARSLWQEAVQAGVKTKMGFTFRYSPAFRRMKELIAEGFIGEPYLFNGFEQNYQFINPKTPFRWNPGDNSKIMPGSLEEYAPHIIDLALWLIGDIKQVVGNMRNYLPERFIRDIGKTLPINIEDASVWLTDFENRAQGTFQSSFVAVGGYPGVEARVYGSKGAIIVRLVEEGGVRESLKIATAENPDFLESEIPERLYGTGHKGDNWIDLCYGNLVQTFVSEILENRESEGNFLTGVKTQEVEDAVFLSHRERRWVTLPLP